MKRIFTNTRTFMQNKSLKLKKGLAITALTVISGFSLQVDAQPANDTIGTCIDVFGYSLGDFHTIYVGLTATDLDDNQKIDALFDLSQDTIKEYEDYSIGVRFANGIIDARNGSSYGADATINYNFDQLYHCWIQTVVYEKTYNVFIQTEGMDKPVQIAEEYSYRNTGITELAIWGTAHNSQGDGSPLLVSNLCFADSIGHIPVIDSTDATLKSLSVTPGKLSPVFSSGTIEYDFVANYGTASVEVSAAPNINGATVTGTGTIDVSSGSGTATVVVTALNKTDQKTYTINISVSGTPPSNDATLSTLTTNTGALDPAFASGTTTYNLLVPTGTASVTLTATPSDKNATVTGDGSINVSSGSGTATIVVTAEDGSTKKTYTVHITVGSGTGQITASQTKIFPNPSNQIFNISMTGTFEYEIYDLSGILIFNGNASEKLVIGENLGSGAYLLRISQNNKTGTFKLFKQ